MPKASPRGVSIELGFNKSEQAFDAGTLLSRELLPYPFPSQDTLEAKGWPVLDHCLAEKPMQARKGDDASLLLIDSVATDEICGRVLVSIPRNHDCKVVTAKVDRPLDADWDSSVEMLDQFTVDLAGMQRNLPSLPAYKRTRLGSKDSSGQFILGTRDAHWELSGDRLRLRIDFQGITGPTVGESPLPALLGLRALKAIIGDCTWRKMQMR